MSSTIDCALRVRLFGLIEWSIRGPTYKVRYVSYLSNGNNTSTEKVLIQGPVIAS